MLEHWRRPRSHYLPLLLLFLNVTLLGTICSAEISSSAVNDNNNNNGQQSKMMEKPIIGHGAAIVAAPSAKEMDHIEGSGNTNNMMEWSDDEDLGGEGSGAQVEEGSGDTEGVQDQPLVPVIISEDVRQTEPTVHTTTTTYQEPRTESSPPTRPPVIAKPPAAGSTDRPTLSVLTAFVIVLWVPLLLC